MAVRQKSSGLPENEKWPLPSQRYDRTAAIRLQKSMPVRPTTSNCYDPNPANFMTPIKSVTGFNETTAIQVVLEEGFAAVAAVHHVVDRAGIFDAKFAGHAGSLPGQASAGQRKTCESAGLTPSLTPSLLASAHRTASPPVLYYHEAQSLQKGCVPSYGPHGSLCTLTLCCSHVLFLHNANTWYGWLTIPYPAETLTLQEAPSFAWRT